MKFGSGCYNVEEAEIIKEPSRLGQRHATINCIVTFLDGAQKHFEMERHARGTELLDIVFDHLELIEKDYFGLQFVDLSPDTDPDRMRWLDVGKSIRKQMQCAPYVLYFRVKFYVPEPSTLLEEYTRYHLFLQVRKDLLDGRLPCPESTATLLGSYIAQSEFGDYNASDHSEHYLDGLLVVPNQTQTMLNKVAELHKLHRGQPPVDAEFNFLEQAKRLEFYGLDIYDAKDSHNSPIELGVCAVGLHVLQNHIRINTFQWVRIMKLSFKRKHFFIQLRDENGTDTIVGFGLGSTTGCKYLWKSCIEHHTFFRLITPPPAPAKSVFSLGSRFRYSGRTEYQTIEEMKRRARVDRSFQRSNSKLSFARSGFRSTMGSERDHRLSSVYSSSIAGDSPVHTPNLSATPRPFMANRLNGVNGGVANHNQNGAGLPPTPEHEVVDSNGTLTLQHQATCSPLLAKSWPVQQRVPSPSLHSENGGSRPNGVSVNGKGTNGDSHLPNKHQSNGHHDSNGYGQIVDDESVTEHSFDLHNVTAPQANGNHHLYQQQMNGRLQPMILPQNQRAPSGSSSQRSASTSAYGRRPLLNGHTNGLGPCTSGTYHTHNGANGNGMVNGHANHNALTSSGNSARSSVTSQRSSLNSLPAAAHQNGNGKRMSPPNGHHMNGYCADEGLVMIRMRPDQQGRFGFNVKGGADQNYPIIVSKVAPGSPAEQCYPRLNEGDQVLVINGHDVAQFTHDQVVRFIRTARETQAGELVLRVRPNVYVGEDIDEPDFQYVPETAHVAANLPKADRVHQSLLLLSDGLSSGAAVMQFEQLYRKKPSLTMHACRLPENLNKNRYRDVAPYDATRVIIADGTGGDYINANFVNMEIPSSGIKNRYIAAQGPLPHTTADFWQVVWEQMSSLVVMLTATVERGRVKCHQYWPRLHETQEYDKLQITCVREQETQSTAVREFTILHKQSKEERQVTQMQYIAWPDHGVPDDPHEFITFVSDVRKARAGSVEPIIVHCSAGIGRTGVSILMESAMCLIEVNEPVYPLELTRTMRDQRAMTIQNAAQFKFVCEAILLAYNESIVKPSLSNNEQNVKLK